MIRTIRHRLTQARAAVAVAAVLLASLAVGVSVAGPARANTAVTIDDAILGTGADQLGLLR